jgi:hypothetical protein
MEPITIVKTMAKRNKEKLLIGVAFIRVVGEEEVD